MTGFQDFMSGWGWVLFSVVSAVFGGGFYLVNQYLRQPGHLLVFWMRVIIVLCMSPFMRYVRLPDDPKFYLAVLVTVFVGTFSDIRSFNASSQYGGGVVARVQPLTVWGTFLLWFLFEPASLGAYLDRPVNAAVILVALLGCVFFSMRLNKCEITRGAFIYMLPALLGYTLTNALNKYAMGRGNLEGAVYGYMYAQSVIAVVSIGIYSLWRQARPVAAGAATPGPQSWVRQELLAASLIAAMTWICHMIYKNYAMAFTPNPSYQVAIGLTTPVFIAIFYYFVQHREQADVKSGMGIVACAVLLALATVH
ncbi:MAG: hypothetical protein EPN97_03200 [Alphaproteobacteria bacterium]|nr:MAG: hypothetical protein EPN97_03200 [Alphaproteobacteria bacterium]